MTADGRIPLFARLFAIVLLPAVALPLAGKRSGAAPALREIYVLASEHRGGYTLLWVVVFGVLLVVARVSLHLWLNEIRPRLSKTYTKPLDYRVPSRKVNVIKQLLALRATGAVGVYFLGLTPVRKWWGWGGAPYVITDRQRTMHMHVLGQTGSGKSASVLFPLALQDILAGKAVIIIDAKGSAENINVIRNLCALAGRTADLRVFSLPFPELSHTYNPLYIEPRTPQSAGGDPLALAERVFSIFKPEMQELYYKNLGESYFRSLIGVLHGIVDERGHSLPFSFRDILECLQNDEVLKHCLARTLDRNAAKNIYLQIKNLGDKATQSFMGLQNMVQKYADSALINATQPDIIIDDVLQKRQVVYFQLPSNYYANLTEDIGKIVLQDIQQAGSRRQIFRDQLDQGFVAIHIDEFSNFATKENERSIISSLNKLRDSNFQFLLSHQTIADLDRISKEFSAGIWDNTRNRIILAQTNPVLAEHLSKSLGTHTVVKSTTRQTVGDLALAVNAGEQSLRDVEEFNLHPNAIKSLAPVGQAYAVEANTFRALNLGCLPSSMFTRTPKEPLVKPRAQSGGLNLRTLGAKEAA